MTEENSFKLEEAIRNLNKKEAAIRDEMAKLSLVKKSYEECKKDFMSNNSRLYTNHEILSVKRRNEQLDEEIKIAEELQQTFEGEVKKIKIARNFKTGVKADAQEFRKLVGKIKMLDASAMEFMYANVEQLALSAEVKLPFNKEELKEVTQKYQEIVMAMASVDPKNPFDYNSIDYLRKNTAITNAKNCLTTIYNFYYSNVGFMITLAKRFKQLKANNDRRIETIKKEYFDGKIKKLDEDISEIEKTLRNDEERLQSIEVVKELYEEYQKNGNKEILVKLTCELTKLLVLSSHDSKKIDK